jgi:aspartate aminotransferase-like enzyme
MRAPPPANLSSFRRHPPFFKIMDEVQQGLRYAFQTSSRYTLCVSGTGHAGMECAIANLVEPGETVVVGNKGIWGARVADMADRFGAKVSAGGAWQRGACQEAGVGGWV